MRGYDLLASTIMAGLFLLGAGLASPTAASILPPPVQQDQKGSLVKAERLEAVANDLLEQGDMDTWEQVAELLEKAARLRPEASLRRAENLRKAANLFVAIGAKERARDLFEEAAAEASETGELAFAAHAYLDAAVLSADLKMGRHTIQAARMADQLAASPSLSRQERVAIESRMERLGLPMRLAQIL